jgi:hypothetical protein
MPDQESKRPKRQYPAFYEKAIPIMLAIIIIGIVTLLIIILVVALGGSPR